MKDNLVSFVVPIYNVARYLEQCIQSLITQTYHNVEIILVNDGSTDGSAKICQYFANKDSRIIYLEQENQGVSVARNLGLCHAKGEWISFVDGDDWVTSDMISRLIENAEDYDVIIGNFFAAENGEIIKTSFFDMNVTEEEKRSTIFLIGNALCCARYGSSKYCSVGTPWAKLYRREFLINNNLKFLPGVRRMQDVLFNVNVFSKTKKITFCDYAVYYYRITNDSACHRYDPKYNDVVDQVLSSLDNCIGKSNSELRELYEFKRLWLLLEYISRYYGHPDCTLPISKRREGIKQLCLDSGNRGALKKYDRKMYTGKQRVILALLSHHLYGITLILYSIKNKRLTIHRLSKTG